MMATLQFTSGFVNITPANPVPLAGHAGRAGPYAGIADDLEANVVILRDGDQFLILITFDLLYVGDWLRRQLERALAPFVQPDHLFLAASHTHFAPATDPALPLVGTVDADFAVMIVGRVEVLVRELMQGEFKPLHAGAGRAQAYHAVNRRRVGWRPSRRWPFLKRGVAMAPNPSGVKDEMISVLRLGTDAVIWNYACHPVFIPQTNHVSSDFVGVVRRSLRAKLGPKTAVLFWQGFSGDVYPSFATTMFGLAARLRQRWYGTSSAVAAGIWTRWTADLAWHVERARANADARPVIGPLLVTRVSCPVSDLLSDGTSDKTLWAHRIQIGADIDILGLSAEMVTAYIRFFREALASPNLLCVGCIDGVFGYVPTSQMVREGGYEAADFFPHFSVPGRFRDNLEQIVQTRLVAPLMAR